MKPFKNHGYGLLTACLMACSASVLANDNQLIMHQCLANKIQTTAKLLAKDGEYRLVAIPEQQTDSLRRLVDKSHCGGFFNVSHKVQAKLSKNNYRQLLKHYLPKKTQNLTSSYELKHPVKVRELIAQIKPNNIWDTVTHLSRYDDRYSKSDNGLSAAHWVKNQFDSLAQKAGRADVNSYFVQTGYYYKQPSIVTVMGKDLPGEAIVLGAHIDTLDYMKPGADDDASGTASLLETARVLLNAKQLKHPVYFVWYAAEELGLIGSSYVVDDFLEKNIKVKAVLQFDMTGYRYQGENKIYLLRDYVDSKLTDFVGKLITSYTDAQLDETRCGYGCSDHASWTQEGFASACPAEASFHHVNPYIHSSRDTMEHLSLPHMTNFSKIGVAFAVELSL